MEIGRKFNELILAEYYLYIDNYKKYSDFNTLGLYRSIIENERLNLEEKVSLRNYAHKTFQKTFDFLQLKDPHTFIKVSHLGQALTIADERRAWDQIRINQQRILDDKRIKHRNFGEYSKHLCGFENCVLNGLMIRQGSSLTELSMHFTGDKNKYQRKLKSDRRKSDRKEENKIIQERFEDQ